MSGDAMLRTPDSNGPASSMSQARKQRVLGFPRLRTASYSFFFLYLEKIYRQRETAPWICMFQYFVSDGEVWPRLKNQPHVLSAVNTFNAWPFQSLYKVTSRYSCDYLD